jgi:hypothetical protein
MKVAKVFLSIIIVIVVVALALMSGAGFFEKVTVSERDMGPFTLIYMEYKGPYNQTGKVFAKVYEICKTVGVSTARGIGIYLDNPRTVAADQLRSECGSVLEGKDLLKIPALLGKGLKVQLLPREASLVAEFPLKNGLSYMIGPAVSYRVLMKYAKQKNFKDGPVYELYDIPAKKIYYVMKKISSE